MRIVSRIFRGLVVFAFLLAAISLIHPGTENSTSLVSHNTTLAAPASASGGTLFDHLVVIMMENEGISDICGGNPPPCNGSNSPYESSLANSYATNEQYLPLIDTSWPDYYGILGASIFGCPSNCYPAPGSITATNLVDRFESAGVTWKAYMENQNAAAGCDTADNIPYESGHNGFIAFQDITTNTARCNNIVLANPTSCTVTDCALVNDLNSAIAPNFMWLSPNDCNNMKAATGCANGCTSGGSSTCIKDGDNYLKSLVPNILSSSTFQSQRSALFIVFDEGTGWCPLNGSSESCIYATWAGPVVKTSYATTTLYNHYSLTKTVETNWNLASLTSNDAGSKAMTEFFNPTAPSPDVSVTASPASLSTVQGSSATSTISVMSLNGYSGTVSLSASVAPTGPTVSLNPNSLTLSSGGSGSSTLTVAVGGTVSAGSYSITVNGASGSLSHSASVSLTVTSAPVKDFSISASPSSISAQQGSSATSTITLTSLNGFTGTVSLADTISPAGPSISLTPTSVTLSSGSSVSSTLSIVVGNTVAAGSYSITVTGTSGSISHSCNISLTVTSVTSNGDFSISANPSTVNLAKSGSGVSQITLTSINGFSGSVSLSAASSNGRLKANLAPTTLTISSGGSGTSTLTLTAGRKLAQGIYTVTITATSGTITHSLTINVTVT